MPRPPLVLLVAAALAATPGAHAQSWFGGGTDPTPEPPAPDVSPAPASNAPDEAPCRAFTGFTEKDQTAPKGHRYSSFTGRAAVVLEGAVLVGERNGRKVAVYLHGEDGAERLPVAVLPFDGSDRLRRVRVQGQDYVVDGNLKLFRWTGSTLHHQQDLGPGIPLPLAALAQVPEADELVIALTRNEAYFVDLLRRQPIKRFSLNLERGERVRAAALNGEYLCIGIGQREGNRIEVFHLPRDASGRPRGRPSPHASIPVDGWIYHLAPLADFVVAGIEWKDPRRSTVSKIRAHPKGGALLFDLHEGGVRRMASSGDLLVLGSQVLRWSGAGLVPVKSLGRLSTVDGFPYFADIRGSVVAAATSSMSSDGEHSMAVAVTCLGEDPEPQVQIQEW